MSESKGQQIIQSVNERREKCGLCGISSGALAQDYAAAIDAALAEQAQKFSDYIQRAKAAVPGIVSGQDLAEAIEQAIAAEREACAKLADRFADERGDHRAVYVATAIRQRGKENK